MAERIETIEDTLRTLGNGTRRVESKAIGHGRLSSVDVLRRIMSRIAEDTGNKDFVNLLEDALRATFAKGVRGTTTYLTTRLQGGYPRDTDLQNQIGVLYAEGSVSAMVEEPGFAEEAAEVARRSQAYQRLAVTSFFGKK